jgi:multidrug efflux pump subunit AcrB
MHKNSIKGLTMNWTGKIAEYFIKNGKLTSLIMVALFTTGVFTFFLTPKKYNPTIVAPAFQVIVNYPGADKTAVIEHITKPLENIISNIAGVEDIYSVSYQGGKAILNVNFYVGEDFDKAKVSLNDRIQTDIDLSPYGIQKPIIKSVDPEDVPVLTFALSSNKLSPVALRKYAFEVRDELAKVNNTGIISIVGGKKRELSITVNETKLEKNAISVKHIENALKAHNVYLPIGHIKGETEFLPIEIDARVRTIEDIKNIVVLSNNTVDIKVKDIATVELKEKEVDSDIIHLSKQNKKENHVLISVAKLKGTNITDVSNSVIDKLNTIILTDDVTKHIIVNDGKVAFDEINGLLANLLTSILIVVLVLVFFLNIKSALLVAISIPLTLSSVFIAAYFGGQSINRITLFALILSLGLLVDNATVVIENIARKLSSAKKVTQDLFAESVNEVGLGLFMSTLTTLLAFFPMAFISGMMGPYMGPIPFFVPAALVIALGISYSINPWLASIIMRKAPEHRPSKMQQVGTKFILNYKHFLRTILSSSGKRKLVLAAIVLALVAAASLPALYLVKFRMLPKANVNQFYVYLDLPEGASFNETLKANQVLEKELLKNKNVQMVQSYIGTAPIIDFNGLFKNVASRVKFNQSTIRVGLIAKENRDIISENLVINIRPQLMKSLSQFPGANLKLIEDPPGPPVMSTYLVRVEGPEAIAHSVTKEISKDLKDVEGVKDFDSSLELDSYTYSLQVNHKEATKTNIPPAQILETLQMLYSGKILGVFHDQRNIEQEFIHLRFDRKSRVSPETLKDIKIFNQYRIAVPLSRLVKIEKVATTPALYRENDQSVVYLYGEMGDRSVTYAGIDTLSYLLDYKPLKDYEMSSWDLFGVNYTNQNDQHIRISIGGEWELTLEVFRDLMLAMLVAIFIIYFVLIAQFKSFTDPLIIMSTIPLSVIGVFPGFMILNFVQGEYFTATSMIGIIALAGIAVNNSIILLEYLQSLKENSVSLIEALVEACATRLRPIALTTITTVLGSMTILGDPVWAGLAWSIVLGLAVSSVLILLVFPVLYYSVHHKKEL